MTKINIKQRKLKPSHFNDNRRHPHGLEYECTDTGNMHRFIDRNHEKARSTGSPKEWLTWDGRRWCYTQQTYVFELALETVESIKSEHKRCKNLEGKKRLLSWKERSESQARLNAMVNMASNNPTMVTQLSDYDRQIYYINSKNGLVDLRTGELIDHNQKHNITKLANVSYHPKAECPTFDKFIQEVFNHDPELIRWMQRAIGYSLTGSVDEQCLFIAYGTGANGKSTLFEVISQILGDYSKTADFETFLNNQLSDVRSLEAVGELKGIRYALASEVDKSRRFSESVVKRLTGGDTLRGTKLRSSAFEFKPEFKLWFLANHLPFVRDGSYGFWRRIKVVPFTQKFAGAKIDKRLPEQLLSEAEGIFAWCVRGAIEWSQTLEMTEGVSGIGSCKAVEDASNDYKSDNDTLTNFIEDTILKEEGSRVSARELYTEYKFWLELRGESYQVPENVFARQMEERGLKKKRTKEGVFYVDIHLNKTHNF